MYLPNKGSVSVGGGRRLGRTDFVCWNPLANHPSLPPILDFQYPDNASALSSSITVSYRVGKSDCRRDRLTEV